MFNCERCRARYSPIRAAILEFCPAAGRGIESAFPLWSRSPGTHLVVEVDKERLELSTTIRTGPQPLSRCLVAAAQAKEAQEA
jgi:hypothetical protein